jgi:hypothetical protein
LGIIGKSTRSRKDRISSVVNDESAISIATTKSVAATVGNPQGITTREEAELRINFLAISFV